MEKRSYKKLTWATLFVFLVTLFSNFSYITKASAEELSSACAPIINADGTVTFSYEDSNVESPATSVYVSGDMNNWGKDNPMTKNANGVWVTTIKCDITGNNIAYKFIVDDNWILDPKNPYKIAGGYGDNSGVKLDGVTKAVAPVINDDGTVTFSYKDDAAKSVNLAGSMNEWSKEATPMTKNEFGVWSVTITPKEGTKALEYKFVVDGAWTQDPNNSLLSGDNSLIKLVSDLDSGSGVIDDNGTIIFRYEDTEASSVYVAGSFNNWDKTKTPMTKNSNEVWEVRVRVGDSAQNVEYKFVVNGSDWYVDPLNTKTQNGNSLVQFPEYKGRIVSLPGTFSTCVEGASGTWNQTDATMDLDYVGNGCYKKTFKNIQAGSYLYKVAINHAWTENYGEKGAFDGSNITLNVPEAMDVTFMYNDDSHRIVTNIDYSVLDIKLNNGTEKLCDMTDDKYVGIYSGSVNLTAGTYDNLNLSVSDGKDTKTVKIDSFTLAADKNVTFSYDPVTGICYNDSSDEKIGTDAIYYDSQNTDYKTPYGASSVGTEISFSINVKTGVAKEAKLVVVEPNGTTVVDMSKNGTFADGNEKWTGKYTPSSIGTYSYYFVVSSESDLKAYGDDDGFFGAGMVSELVDKNNYEFNVYTSDYKTPDWLKNGVMMQIYPDRFFNGDTSNDYAQKYARGGAKYEFVTDWYSLPKDPQLYNDEKYVENANRGSSDWSNDLYGGDLKGIEAKLDYLQGVGVNILYLTPIGQSISSHRYDTTDYTDVDPQLGDLDDFIELATAAKSRGMHIILDGVYNHVSDDSIYFDRFGKYVAAGKPLGAYQYWAHVYDLMNNDGISKEVAEAKTVEYYKSIGITDLHYKDWFVINNVFDKDSNHYTYEGWAGYDSMPVIRTENGSEYQVKSWANEIINNQDSVAKQWLNMGSSGWRLDVANEVSDETWRAFRKEVKGNSSDNAIIGEIWTDASKYLLGDMYDSVMNYRFRGAALGYVQGSKTDDNSKTPYNAVDAMNELEKMREQYPREALEVMMNLVDSHDTQRAISSMDGYGKGGENRDFAKQPSDSAVQKMKVLSLIQMTYPGTPMIYYGDEMGQVGCDDPDNRRAVPWGEGNKELVEWYAQMTSIRDAYSALRTGEISPAKVQESDLVNDVLAYIRYDDNDKIAVATNRTDKDIKVTITTPGIADGTVLTDLLNSKGTYTVKDGKVTVSIPAYRGAVLVNNVRDISFNANALTDAYDSSKKVDTRTICEDEDTILQRIKDATEGSEVVISTMNEGISKTVLQAIVDSKKDLIPVIQRGDIKIVVKDVPALIEKLSQTQDYDFLCVLNKDTVTESGQLYNLELKTNLDKGELGGVFEIQLPVDSKYNGNELYCYYNNNGKLEKMDSNKVVDGKFLFKTTHFSQFVVYDKAVSVNNNDNGSDNNGADNNGNIKQTNNQTVNSTSNGSGATKTNDGLQMPTIIILSILFMVTVAAISIDAKRKRRENC